MTTQLFIAGVEVVLPQSFSVTVKRENPFFTKSGEYTYDCQLRLDNPTNQQLYQFLFRLNNTAQVPTGRTAILMADGHVYCRGTEVITQWTDQTVSVQIVSGESELNWIIGQDRKIEDINPGSVAAVDCCYPIVINAAGKPLNVVHWSWNPDGLYEWNNVCPQPYLPALVEKIVTALGYQVVTNQLRGTDFEHLFIVNTTGSYQIGDILGGWTVKDFLQELEKLLGIVFVTDNTNQASLRCSIMRKTRYYEEARQLPLSDVVDAYEAETEDEGSEEFTASNVSYDLPDGRWSKLMKLPDYMPADAQTEEYGSLADIATAAWAATAADHTIYTDTSTGRKYIRADRHHTRDDIEWTEKFLIEVDQFADLDRQDADTTLELKITPAPLSHTCPFKVGEHNVWEVVDLSSIDTYDIDQLIPGNGIPDSGDDEDGEEETFEDAIREAEKKDKSAEHLYCAFCDGGLTIVGTIYKAYPVVYTDTYHAYAWSILYSGGLHADTYHVYPGNIIYSGEFDYPDTATPDPGTPSGSLRLQDLDSDYYQGGYQTDTAHTVTFETFDPNVIDTRQVYVIRNRRYVVRDVEETVTAEGRSPLWRVTCYPIEISDEAIDNGWILTRGVWDDGAAWLDDGRWNDGE